MRGGSVPFFGLALLLALTSTVPSRGAEKDEDAFFETNIRPVLASSCIECHGPKKASGGLRLDSRDGLYQGGDSGPALEAGNAESSLLVRAIRREPDAEIKMPPEKPLSKQAVADLTRWIDAGAKWPDSVVRPIASDRHHWAFEPLQTIAIPEDPSGWATQTIDRLIARAQQENGVVPVPPASKSALLRRAYFDLIGLPPTPKQVEAFLADSSPSAFARVVDALLSSQRYGERWARHWLDLVRYADTAGELVTESSAVQKELGLSPNAVEKIAELQAQIAKESSLEIEKISNEGGLNERGWRLLFGGSAERLAEKMAISKSTSERKEYVSGERTP